MLRSAWPSFYTIRWSRESQAEIFIWGLIDGLGESSSKVEKYFTTAFS